MNTDFRQYATLNINPVDDLLSDRYDISQKLGNGITTTVYSLAEKK
jgi:hypothetical protein